MCWTRTPSYTICAHRRTSKQHCENYLSKPKKKCEKLHYNDIFLDLCPKCSRTPSQPVLNLPLAFSPRSGAELVQSSQATTFEDHKEVEMSVRMKVVGGLRRIMGSMRRSERNNKSKVIRTEAQRQRKSSRTSDTTERVISSEQLANEYRGIIGCHPNVAPSIYGPPRGTVESKPIDIETCTTWSRFLPKSVNLPQGVPEGIKTERRESE
jgi:hypothetical protein